ncbi:antimicrobial peptide system protein, SdpB family [Bergeyella zoohelcum]|uniref:Antimicrobial peptide system protein, SdpB family n=2 Tax=Bergeyella zoohelcum TaxID=1015 RepID=A0A7Z8YN31_9FLAO|nr:antimicrobial peptide system protein, SdpB family [Bergeyella zoohelcum]
MIFRSIPQYNYGYDNFITMSLFYCLLFPTNRKLILKKKKNTENIDKLNIHPYFNLIVFLKIHLCIVYFVSGVAKVVDINWWNGNAIMRAMATTTTEYVLPAILLAIISLLTVTIELVYPILAFSKYKKFLVLDIILLHIGIGFILGLSSFAAIMIVWNVVAFYKTLNFLKNYA